MNNILDSIINGGESNTPANTPTPVAAPVAAPAHLANIPGHSFETGQTITESGLEQATHRLASGDVGMVNPDAWRGRGRDVHALNNDPTAILNEADLNWRTIPLQLAMRGRTETRDIEGMKALVRSDNGGFLAVASDSYKPHHNTEIVGALSNWANDSGLTITRMGEWDGGKRIWAAASSQISADVKVGDRFALQIMVRSGHEPGIATTVRAVALRLVCSNGAWVNDTALNIRWTHRSGLTSLRMGDTRRQMAQWSGAFDRYMEDMAKLYSLPLPKLAARVFLADVIQPALIEDIARQLHIERRADIRLGADIVSRMLDSDRDSRLVSRLITNDAGRLLRAVTNATSSQTGGDLTDGTLAHAYNGITFYNSHLRGRDADAALESQMYGEGGRMAVEARRAGLEYVQALAPRLGVR